MKCLRKLVVGCILLICIPQVLHGAVIFVPNTELTPTVPPAPAGSQAGANGYTSVRKFDLGAELPGMGINSIDGFTLFGGTGGGANGVFTGFDLDGVVLSTTDVSAYADIATIVPLNVFAFNLSTQSDLTPGLVDLTGSGASYFSPSVDVNSTPYSGFLFGTDGAGNIDNAVATLESFDAYATVNDLSLADGWVSLGDGGSINFSLTSAVSTSGLFLYIGEVGDNGEIATTGFEFSETPDPIVASSTPEPTTAAIWGAFSLIGICTMRRKRNRRV